MTEHADNMESLVKAMFLALLPRYVRRDFSFSMMMSEGCGEMPIIVGVAKELAAEVPGSSEQGEGGKEGGAVTPQTPPRSAGARARVPFSPAGGTGGGNIDDRLKRVGNLWGQLEDSVAPLRAALEHARGYKHNDDGLKWLADFKGALRGLLGVAFGAWA